MPSKVGFQMSVGTENSVFSPFANLQCFRRVFCCSTRSADAGSAKAEKVDALQRGPIVPVKLFFATLNEGDLILPASRVQAAATASIRGLCPDNDLESISAVVLARQEAHSSNAELWEKAWASLGFPHSVVQADLKLRSQIAVYSRDPVSWHPLFEATVSSQKEDGSASGKGVVAVFVQHHGLKLCFACCHLDGNLVDDVRLAPIPATLDEACMRTGEDLDGIFIMGDINSTIVPTKEAEALTDFPQLSRSCSTLQSELLNAGTSDQEKCVVKLTEPLKKDLLDGLSTYQGRVLLHKMDGCPKQIASSSQPTVRPISAVNLVPMPEGSFPTYRLCSAQPDTFNALRKTSFGSDDTGMFFMNPSLEVTPSDIHALYFLDKKGHSGSIKKRGNMCRLGLGWLDRLYVGKRDDIVDVNTNQGIPIFLLDKDNTALDHNLMPWLVKIEPRSEQSRS